MPYPFSLFGLLTVFIDLFVLGIVRIKVEESLKSGFYAFFTFLIKFAVLTANLAISALSNGAL